MSLAVVCAAEHVLGRGISKIVQIASVNYQQQERTEAAGCRSNSSPICSLPNSWPVCFKVKWRMLLFVALMLALRTEQMVEFSCVQTAWSFGIWKQVFFHPSLQDDSGESSQWYTSLLAMQIPAKAPRKDKEMSRLLIVLHWLPTLSDD